MLFDNLVLVNATFKTGFYISIALYCTLLFKTGIDFIMNRAAAA